MKDSTRTVFEYLKKTKGKNLTADQIAAATGLTKKQVDGVFTMAIQKKGYGTRIPAQVQDKDGNYVNVKYLTLSDVGYLVDLDAK